MTTDSRAPRTDLRALFGEQIWLAAIERGWTQADLADHVGLSEKHVSHIINGKSGSPEGLDETARRLGMRWEVRLIRDPNADPAVTT